MHEAEAEQTTELIEVTNEEPSEPEPEPEVETPETVIGLVHQAGQTAEAQRNLEEDVADLRAQLTSLRSEVAGIARVEAEHLLDEIIQEGESGEMQAEAEAAPAPSRPSWWERLLGG